MHISSGLNNDHLRVGIVLPEDNIQDITLSWPAALDMSSSVLIPEHIHELSLSVEDGKIRIQNISDILPQSQLTLSSPDDVEELAAQSGIHLQSVVAGRGFHWEKRIGVYLPGELTITVANDQIKIINNLDVEAYVACVATSEMGAEAPADLLAAQTVVARCWSLALAEAKHLEEGFDVCNDDCCQRYQGSSFLSEHSLKAAVDTKGQVLVYDNKVIDARYSKSCGGMVEDYQTAWEGDHVPYLIPLWDGPKQLAGHAVDNLEKLWEYDDAYCSSKRFESVNLAGMLGKVDESGSYYRWEKIINKTDILNNLKKYAKLSWVSITGLRIEERGFSGRIKYLYLQGLDENHKPAEQMVQSEYGIRQMFSNSFLYSSAFVVRNPDTLTEDDHIALRGVGWGHGVGLCQMGALGMALDHIEYKDILAHYYPGITFTTL